MKIIKPSKADEEEGENMENVDDGNHDTEEDEGISWGMGLFFIFIKKIKHNEKIKYTF